MPHVRGHVRRSPAKWFRPRGHLQYKGDDWHAWLPAHERRRILRGHVRVVGYATVIRQLNALRNVTKDRETRRALKMDMAYLRRRYRPEN